MKSWRLIVFIICVTVIGSSAGWARAERVGQIPNGSKFSCSNCHAASGGGGQRNPFGVEVENNYLQGGVVEWKAALASLDSDGDGKTNGSELQDPTGVWRTGAPDPGEVSLVTNPGVADNLTPPGLISPDDNTVGTSFSVELKWNSVPNAENYRVEVSEFNNFSSFAFKVDQTSSKSVFTTVLKPNVQYYWRVKALKSSTSSNWSEVWKFKTKLATPTLVTPAAAASGVALPAMFVWNAVNGALSYNIDFSTSIDFSSIAASRQGILDTTVSIGDLEVNKTYYWRVRADAAPSLSDWSEARSFNTILPGPKLVSPVSGAIGVEPVVELIWNKLEGVAIYNLQIDTVNNFERPVLIRSSILDTTTTLTELDYHKIYYWRVNGGIAPETSQWSDIWNFRVKPQGPILIEPEMDFKGADTNLVFKWERIQGVLTYKLEISSTEDFVNIVTTVENVTGTSVTAGGLSYNTLYFWRVSAQTPAVGEFSEFRSFRTGAEPPVLEAPANDAAGVSSAPHFSWNYTVPGNYKYEIQIAKNTAFTGASHIVLGKTYDTTGLEQNTKYFWRVRAISGATSGAWSQPWSFTTKLGPPALVYPENDAKNLSLTVFARWAAVQGSQYYMAQLASDALFNEVIFSKDSIPGLNVEFKDLTSGTKYFWRVLTKNGDSFSDWSEIRSFTTGYNVPILLLPENGAVGQPLTLKLKWSANHSSIFYNIQVALDDQFTNIHYEHDAQDTSLTLTDLPDKTTFYWRVNSQLESGISPWSETRSFTTLDKGIVEDTDVIVAKISPNPATDFIKAEMKMSRPASVKIFVIDVLGRVSLELGSREYGEGAVSSGFDISPLPSGAYRLILEYGEGAVSLPFIKTE